MNGNEPIESDLSVGTSDALERNEPMMPLTSGEFGEEQGIDAFADGGTSKRFKSGTILVLLVVGVAIAGLISMRTLARVTAAHTGATDIEQTIEKWIAGMLEGGDNTGTGVNSLANADALQVLNAPYSERQVPLNDVAKNPFVLPGDTEYIGDPEIDPVDALLAEREKQIAAARGAIERAAGRLEVKSIMMGSSPLANVSGQIVQVEDVIMVEEGGEEIELFVKSLTTSVVTVVAHRPDLDLTIETELRLDRE